jgi:membrane protease YdiL (CAAX protease family)
MMPERAGRARIVAEALGAFAAATLIAALLYHAQGVPFIRYNLHALVALVFLALPQLLLKKHGGIERYGFTLQPPAIGLTIAALAILVVLPLFSAGFVIFMRQLCAHAATLVPGSCARVLHPHWRLPPDFAWLSLAQLLVVALPEELFFRGYLQGRLEEALPPTVNVFGARLGWAWILAAALFALGHYLVSFEPQMLTRFFPGLVFGWMYARTRSILAGTIFHAACNLIMALLAASLFVA